MQKDFIDHKHYGHIELTQKGYQQAEELYKIQRILVDFLTKILGVCDEIAEEDAQKWNMF